MAGYKCNLHFVLLICIAKSYKVLKNVLKSIYNGVKNVQMLRNKFNKIS